jgi:hypothetical protein
LVRSPGGVVVVVIVVGHDGLSRGMEVGAQTEQVYITGRLSARDLDAYASFSSQIDAVSVRHSVRLRVCLYWRNQSLTELLLGVLGPCRNRKSDPRSLSRLVLSIRTEMAENRGKR